MIFWGGESNFGLVIRMHLCPVERGSLEEGLLSWPRTAGHFIQCENLIRNRTHRRINQMPYHSMCQKVLSHEPPAKCAQCAMNCTCWMNVFVSYPPICPKYGNCLKKGRYVFPVWDADTCQRSALCPNNVPALVFEGGTKHYWIRSPKLTYTQLRMKLLSWITWSQ